MDSKTKDIIEHLLSLTKDGKIEWQYANSENAFKIELNSATLVISYISSDFLSGEDDIYSLDMYNGTGKPIGLAALSRSDNQDDYQLLIRLFFAARESTDKKESTLDKILEELNLKDLPF